MIYTLPFDKYLCVSNATKKDLLKLNIKEKKVITIHNGFDYNSWDPEKIAVEDIEKIREEHSLKENFSLFSWGRPGESKGFEYLLKALPSIKERIPNVLLLLMLSSVNNYKENYQKLIALIKTLGIEKQVKIIQPVPHSELKKYLKAVDGVVIPSTAEGFGYTTVETNAIGTPAVVSNAGSLPEVVSGKFLMFESKNITELAEKVVKLSKKEYQETELKKFLWDDSIEKYLEVYTSLIDKK